MLPYSYFKQNGYNIYIYIYIYIYGIFTLPLGVDCLHEEISPDVYLPLTICSKISVMEVYLVWHKYSKFSFRLYIKDLTDDLTT